MSYREAIGWEKSLEILEGQFNKEFNNIRSVLDCHMQRLNRNSDGIEECNKKTSGVCSQFNDIQDNLNRLDRQVYNIQMNYTQDEEFEEFKEISYANNEVLVKKYNNILEYIKCLKNDFNNLLKDEVANHNNISVLVDKYSDINDDVENIGNRTDSIEYHIETLYNIYDEIKNYINSYTKEDVKITHDFVWALEQINKGNKVKISTWCNDIYIYLKEGGLVYQHNHNGENIPFILSKWNMNCYNWEVVK